MKRYMVRERFPPCGHDVCVHGCERPCGVKGCNGCARYQWPDDRCREHAVVPVAAVRQELWFYHPLAILAVVVFIAFLPGCTPTPSSLEENDPVAVLVVGVKPQRLARCLLEQLDEAQSVMSHNLRERENGDLRIVSTWPEWGTFGLYDISATESGSKLVARGYGLRLRSQAGEQAEKAAATCEATKAARS
jgi:hypothetical protein